MFTLVTVHYFWIVLLAHDDFIKVTSFFDRFKAFSDCSSSKPQAVEQEVPDCDRPEERRKRTLACSPRELRWWERLWRWTPIGKNQEYLLFLLSSPSCPCIAHVNVYIALVVCYEVPSSKHSEIFRFLDSIKFPKSLSEFEERECGFVETHEAFCLFWSNCEQWWVVVHWEGLTKRQLSRQKRGSWSHWTKKNCLNWYSVHYYRQHL